MIQKTPKMRLLPQPVNSRIGAVLAAAILSLALALGTISGQGIPSSAGNNAPAGQGAPDTPAESRKEASASTAAQGSPTDRSRADQRLGFIFGLVSALVLLAVGKAWEFWINERSRKHALKQSVLLEAAQSTAMLQGFLVGIGDLRNASAERRLNLGEHAGWINKLHLIVDEGTIQRFLELGEYFADQLITLGKQRFELDNLVTAHESLGKQLDEARTEEGRRLAELQILATVEDPVARDRWPAIMKELQDIRAAIPRLHGEHEAIGDRRFEDQRKLIVMSAEAGRGFALRLAEANIAARVELGLKMDSKRYRTMMLESQDKLLSKLQAAIGAAESPADLRKSVSEDRDGSESP